MKIKHNILALQGTIKKCIRSVNLKNDYQIEVMTKYSVSEKTSNKSEFLTRHKGYNRKLNRIYSKTQ